MKHPALWDLPIRLFHWSLVLLFALSWASVENGFMQIHIWSGTAILFLLVFRVIWGGIGTPTARFTNFLRPPSEVAAYLRTLPAPTAKIWPGHNPMGGWSVAVMLCLLALQVGFGLFAVDVDFVNSGPLNKFVSYDAGRTAAALHGLTFNLLIAVIGLHVAAVVFYRVRKKENLVLPMITGRKDMSKVEAHRIPVMGRYGTRAAASVLAAALIAFVIVYVIPALH